MSAPREVVTAPPALPASLQALLAGSHWLRNQVGEAGADVFRVLHPDGRALYLKHGRDDAAEAVVDEMGRLDWLARHAPKMRRLLPERVHFECQPGQAWLLSTALPGRTAYQWLAEAPQRAWRLFAGQRAAGRARAGDWIDRRGAPGLG